MYNLNVICLFLSCGRPGKMNDIMQRQRREFLCVCVCVFFLKIWKPTKNSSLEVNTGRRPPAEGNRKAAEVLKHECAQEIPRDLVKRQALIQEVQGRA